MMTKLRAKLESLTTAARAVLRRALRATRGARDTVSVGECRRATVEHATGADDVPRETVTPTPVEAVARDLAPLEVAPRPIGSRPARPSRDGPDRAAPSRPARLAPRETVPRETVPRETVPRETGTAPTLGIGHRDDPTRGTDQNRAPHRTDSMPTDRPAPSGTTPTGPSATA